MTQKITLNELRRLVKQAINEENDQQTEKLFNYDIIKVRETEKAVLIKFKVYKNKEGKEEFLETWLPKSILNNENKVFEFIEKAVYEKNRKYSDWMKSKGFRSNHVAYTTSKPKEKEKIVTITYYIAEDSPKPPDVRLLQTIRIQKDSILLNDYEIANDENLQSDINGYYIKEKGIKLLMKIKEKYPNFFIQKHSNDSVKIVEKDLEQYLQEVFQAAENRGVDLKKATEDFKNEHGYYFQDLFVPLKDIKIKKRKTTQYF